MAISLVDGFNCCWYCFRLCTIADKVDLHYRLVYFLFQPGRDPFKLKYTCAFQQNVFVFELMRTYLLQKIIC
jgi:hypothetical protein